MIEDLEMWMNQEPFIPFRVVLTSGSSYDVTSPLRLVPAPAKLTYFYSRSNRVAVLRLNQLAALETLSE